MWTSLPTALMAILLLSDPALARRKVTVTIEACPAETTSMTATSTDTPSPEADGLLNDLNNGAVQVAVSTVTVIPLPVTTASGIFYPGFGTGTGTGYASPTGHHRNGTKNGTLPANTTSLPFFTLKTTASLTLPTESEASPTAASTSVSISTSISIPTPTNPVIPPSSPETTSTSSSKPATTSTAPASTSIPFLRGVNLGGWLVLEKWMDGDVFTGKFASAVDQYTFDQIDGAKAALETHWSTFFTEEDIANIAATGINALRIPIGYWAYDNSNTPYITGADQYLEQAIGWARTHGMKVWVDCHGSPGSQNGFDNSGRAGVTEWQQEANLQQSISVLKTMATKYGASSYADVVVGLELTNEPISWGTNVFSVTQSWAQKAYAAVKAVVENDNLVIVMHDSFQTPLAWTSIASGLIAGGARTFGVDTHLYGLFTDAEDGMTQAQHITEACGWAHNLKTANAVMPTYVGEWSPATNICVNPDGSTTAGTSCSVSGCQCQSADISEWNPNMIAAVRRYVEAQMDAFESSSSGYFMWAAKGPGGWGFLNGIANGAVPNPVTSRKYPGQCGGGSKRRDVRGGLGVGGEAF